MPVYAPLYVSDNYHLLKPKLRPLHCTAKKEKSCLSGRDAGLAWIMSLPTAGKVRGGARGALYGGWGVVLVTVLSLFAAAKTNI